MNIALIYAASPVLIAVAAVWWLGERFSTRQGVGVVIAMVGVFHVVVKGQWLALGQVQWVAGDGWIVLAMVLWAAYALLQNVAHRTGFHCAIGGDLHGRYAGVVAFCRLGIRSNRHTRLDPEGHPLVVAAGLLPGIGAYWAYGFCQKVLGASRVAASSYLGPLYGGLAAWLVLSEAMG